MENQKAIKNKLELKYREHYQVIQLKVGIDINEEEISRLLKPTNRDQFFYLKKNNSNYISFELENCVLTDDGFAHFEIGNYKFKPTFISFRIEDFPTVYLRIYEAISNRNLVSELLGFISIQKASQLIDSMIKGERHD